MRFLLPIAMTATVLVVCVKSARRQPRLETVVVFGLVIICYSWAWVVTA